MKEIYGLPFRLIVCCVEKPCREIGRVFLLPLNGKLCLYNYITTKAPDEGASCRKVLKGKTGDLRAFYLAVDNLYHPALFRALERFLNAL